MRKGLGIFFYGVNANSRCWTVDSTRLRYMYMIFMHGDYKTMYINYKSVTLHLLVITVCTCVCTDVTWFVCIKYMGFYVHNHTPCVNYASTFVSMEI